MITRLTPKVLNSDSDVTLLKPDEMVAALNVHISGKNMSDAGVVKNAASNKLVQVSEQISQQLPNGKNSVIGSVSDENLQVIYFFIYNDQSQHSIWAYSAKTETHRVIFKGPQLNFEENGFVKGDLVRIKRSIPDEQFIFADETGTGGAALIDQGETVQEIFQTVQVPFFIGRDLSHYGELLRINAPEFSDVNNEIHRIGNWTPPTQDDLFIKATLTITCPTNPSLAVFYPSVGGTGENLNFEVLGNEASYSTITEALINSNTPEIDNGWQKTKEFSVNLHPSIFEEEDFQITVNLSLASRVDASTEYTGTDAITNAGGDINPGVAFPVTQTMSLVNKATAQAALGSGDPIYSDEAVPVPNSSVTNARWFKAFGHDVLAKDIKVSDLFGYNSSDAVAFIDANNLAAYSGGKYAKTSGFAWSRWDAGEVSLGSRKAYTKIKVDYADTSYYQNYLTIWQILWEAQNSGGGGGESATPGPRTTRDECGETYEFFYCFTDTSSVDFISPADLQVAVAAKIAQCPTTEIILTNTCVGGELPDNAYFNPVFLAAEEVLFENDIAVNTSFYDPISPDVPPPTLYGPNGETPILDGTPPSSVMTFQVPVIASGPGTLFSKGRGSAVASRNESHSAMAAIPSSEAVSLGIGEHSMYVGVTASNGQSTLTSGETGVINRSGAEGEEAELQEAQMFGAGTYSPRSMTICTGWTDEVGNHGSYAEALWASQFASLGGNWAASAIQMANGQAVADPNNAGDFTTASWFANFSNVNWFPMSGGGLNTNAFNESFCYRSIDNCAAQGGAPPPLAGSADISNPDVITEGSSDAATDATTDTATTTSSGTASQGGTQSEVTLSGSTKKSQTKTKKKY